MTSLRLRLHYPELPFSGNYEFIPPVWELKPDKVNDIDKDRFTWVHEVVASDWSPFVILPKATATKHLLFETRWEQPVVQEQVVVTLELQADGRSKWLSVAEWKIVLSPHVWVDLQNGCSIGYSPAGDQIALESECSPPDLHKYTGTKATLPTEGMISAAKSSYLNYPESEKDQS